MSWGEIYNTSWWGVALDTARTVKARPDFFGSQLNLLTSEQPNLVTNGTFATDSDWSKGVGWNIVNGKATASSVSGGYLVQSLNLTNTKVYKIQFTISDYVSGDVRVRFSGGAGFISTDYVSGNNTHTLYLQSIGNTVFRIQGQNNFTGSIDNVSVQVVRADLDQIEAKKCLADWIHTTALKDLNN